MKRVIMVGHVACGKTTLSQRLNGLKQTYQKTQALEFLQNSIDTPGEYLERRSLVHALMVTSVEADVALFIHDATAERFMFAPGLAGSFPIPVIGVVNKIDCATPQQRADARELLELAGAGPIFEISEMCIRDRCAAHRRADERFGKDRCVLRDHRFSAGFGDRKRRCV